MFLHHGRLKNSVSHRTYSVKFYITETANPAPNGPHWFIIIYNEPIVRVSAQQSHDLSGVSLHLHFQLLHVTHSGVKICLHYCLLR